MKKALLLILIAASCGGRSEPRLDDDLGVPNATNIPPDPAIADAGADATHDAEAADAALPDCFGAGVTVLADEESAQWVKYIHGDLGKGTWTFFGGHDPEDPQHQIGDPPTDLSLHPHSPGYRLILNNVLFPAAKKRELKT